MAEIGSKFGLGGGGGIHFKEPWLLQPYIATVGSLKVQDNFGSDQTAATVAFFTEIARRGAQDTTNWTSDTYKTLLTVSSGKGLVAALIGPTAGGSSTTTFEITVDGVLTEIAVTGLASGKRAMLSAPGAVVSGPATTTALAYAGDAALDSGKQIFSEVPTSTSYVPTHQFMAAFGVPMLRFNQSLLIRAKHSASITNSTATAYSGIVYRLGL